ncbi:hypothetical protein K0M31_019200 [Melipona bicolor]|uniref:Uncharacterized protein n=1 Tax=Melipona bicolor TaxID=60889 RepID=A0AA40G2B0_9HYME|nr:hypothetical protein K0M31_019200 [Melipona bicolor]
MVYVQHVPFGVGVLYGGWTPARVKCTLYKETAAYTAGTQIWRTSLGGHCDKKVERNGPDRKPPRQPFAVHHRSQRVPTSFDNLTFGQKSCEFDNKYLTHLIANA